MKDNEGNAIASSAFISAAERYQLMPQIDRWVISKTIASIAANPVGHRPSLAPSFRSTSRASRCPTTTYSSSSRTRSSEAGLPPSALGFEVTESAAVSNLAKAQQLITALRDHGCRISLDDFGAGLSSFAYLKNFSVDILKIDGGFIRDITDNRISESMVAAITQVAKVMELVTVAEYVESEKTRRLITELGVDFAQGHAIGKPVPFVDVLAELSDQTRESTA